MTATAEVLIRHGERRCSRCGARMQPELLWHEQSGKLPSLLYRCGTGHITQALPIPSELLHVRGDRLVGPRIGLTA